ncbi:MAG: hypothetical protein HY396_02680 [Candidatus Doudnabacteria bacterium]|nr:hypothetical protein [Candidatus Doudnabacteria bacterium]
MKLKTKVGQIFLTHPKDENFTSLYEEAFSKHGDAVELFAILDISGISFPELKTKKKEYEKLVQMLVAAFKKAYIASQIITPETFEQALSDINSAVSKLLTQNKVSWYGKLNVAIGALFRGELSISVTGNALIYLWRKGEPALLSEELAEAGLASPVKLFSNYSVGKIYKSDKIIFSTKQLFNYISLDRLQEFFKEETLEDTCQEIIASLQEVKTAGIAAFACEITNGGPQLKITEPLQESANPAIHAPQSVKILKIARRAIWSFLKFLWWLTSNLIGSAIGFIAALWRRDRKYKKYLFAAIALVILFLIYNIGQAVWQKSQTAKKQQSQSVLSQIEEGVNQAEASLIYNDEERALSLVLEAEKLFQNLNKKLAESSGNLEERIRTLKNKINRETLIDNPVLLTQFPNIPTDLYYSPNGFLGFNRSTQSSAFYDFRTGETRPLLQNQNTGNLVLGDFVGGTEGYVFLVNTGKFAKFDIAEQSLTEYQSESALVDLASSKIQALAVLGEAAAARVYLLDKAKNQIWRVRASEAGLVSQAEPWLKTSDVSFGDAADIAVDNNIYVLFPDHLEKYFNGQKQNFALSSASPSLKKAKAVFTRQGFNFIYIADPENQRVLIYNKSGKRERQITSPKFRDLSDIYVDEAGGLLYALAGPELLQISLK